MRKVASLKDKIKNLTTGIGLLCSNNIELLDYIEDLTDKQSSPEFKSLSDKEKYDIVNFKLGKIYKKTLSVHEESFY